MSNRDQVHLEVNVIVYDSIHRHTKCEFRYHFLICITRSSTKQIVHFIDLLIKYRLKTREGWLKVHTVKVT